MPTQLDKLPVSIARESTAWWSRQPARTCAIYVHGYGGRAVTSWGQFPDLAVESPECENVDLIFLGYESRTRTAAYSMGVLFQAITMLIEETPKVLRTVGGPDRGEDFTYEKVILVGHSLGGALVRDVAMNAKTQGKPWAEKLSLALFAPAHIGATVIDLVGISLGFFRYIGAFQALVRVRSPVLHDLKNKSDYLNALLDKAKAIGLHGTTQAKLVVHASNDLIVDQNPFFQDPPATPYNQHDHNSCCKPVRLSFLNPVEDVVRLLA